MQLLKTCGMCILCPYGLFFAVPFCSAVIALLFTAYATVSCDFFEVDYREEGIFTSEEKSVFNVGPWTVEDFTLEDGLVVDTGDCVFWSDHDTLNKKDLDTPLWFARIFLMLACGPGILSVLYFSFGNCCVLSKLSLRFLKCSFFAYGIFVPIGLISLLSDWCKDADNCAAGWPAIAVIVAFFLWFAAGLSMMLLKERELSSKSTDEEDDDHDERGHDDDEDDDYEDEEEQDDDDSKNDVKPTPKPVTKVSERQVKPKPHPPKSENDDDEQAIVSHRGMEDSQLGLPCCGMDLNGQWS